jgi:hypothetical protein
VDEFGLFGLVVGAFFAVAPFLLLLGIARHMADRRRQAKRMADELQRIADALQRRHNDV